MNFLLSFAINFILLYPVASSSPNGKENQTTMPSTPAPCVFGQENLSDCGLSKDNLELFCSSDLSQVQLMESLKFSGGLYTWI